MRSLYGKSHSLNCTMFNHARRGAPCRRASPACTAFYVRSLRRGFRLGRVKSSSAVLPILVIFALFWSAIVLALDFFIAGQIAGGWRSRSFAEAPGHVRSSTLTRHVGKHVSYTADLVYEYTVDGRTFTGSKVRYGVWSSSSGRAQDVVDAHPAGSATVVRFDPANPSDAVLEPGLSGQNLFTTILLAPFNVIMLAVWIGVVSAIRASKSAPIAGGVSISASALETRVRMPRMTAHGAGLMALGGFSFLTIFLVAIGTDMDPSIRTVCAAWAGIVGLSALVFAWRWRRLQSGAEDLVLDQGSRILTLPRTFGRKESVTVSFREVNDVTVVKVERANRRRRASYTWEPTIQFKDGRREETLADWRSNEKAEAFTAWLREKIGLPAAN